LGKALFQFRHLTRSVSIT
jgi:hypothetical protein